MTSPFKKYVSLIEESLSELSPSQEEVPPALHEAMRYSLLNGGKRLRGMLVMAGSEAVGGTAEAVLPAAVAVEMIHAYSLIHDDLPCMDDADLRRGQPANHKVYGEAVALLAGDALLTEAFKLITDLGLIFPPERVLAAIRTLAIAAGSRGMVGGQVEDLANTGELSISRLDWINDRKTGALIASSLTIGAQLAGGKAEEIAVLERYGIKVGRAFQIVDDVLDETGDTEVLGKPKGNDKSLGKGTYPGLLGVREAQAIAAELLRDAKDSLKELSGQTGLLVELADYILARDH